MRAYLGGDPGKSGAFAVVKSDGSGAVWKMPATELDTIHLCRTLAKLFPGITGLVEKVSSSPQMGVTSAFTFGGSYKEMRMSLASAGIGFDDVLPRAWQKELGMKKKPNEANTPWKNRLKAKAQQLYPGVRITLATADALLIAHVHMKMST
jgi:hypothetical protein